MNGISLLNFCFVRLVNIEDTIDPPPLHTVLQHHLPLWVWIIPYWWEYFHLLCFLFLHVWCVFLMRHRPGFKEAFLHQVSILPHRWCFFHGSLCGFTNDRDWTGCMQLILHVIGIPIYVFVKVPHQGFRWLGSSLQVFTLCLPQGCWACWCCTGDGIEVAQVAR